MNPFIKIKILSTDKILYEGEGRSLSSVNGRGEFDVLADHSNFISLIGEAVNIMDREGKLINIRINSGILRVKEGSVEVYVSV